MSSFLNGFAWFLAWRKIWFIYSVLSKSCLIQTFQYAVLHHLLGYLQISSSQIREDTWKCLHLLVQYLSPGISSRGPPSGFTNSPLIFCPDSLGKWCPGGHEQPLVSTFLSGYFVCPFVSGLAVKHHWISWTWISDFLVVSQYQCGIPGHLHERSVYFYELIVS